MENEITDLQQRLDFSKHEQSDDAWYRGSGFNKLPLAISPLFYFSAHNLMRMCVCVLCVCLCVCCDVSKVAAFIVARCVKLKCCY